MRVILLQMYKQHYIDFVNWRTLSLRTRADKFFSRSRVLLIKYILLKINTLTRVVYYRYRGRLRVRSAAQSYCENRVALESDYNIYNIKSYTDVIFSNRV